MRPRPVLHVSKARRDVAGARHGLIAVLVLAALIALLTGRGAPRVDGAVTGLAHAAAPVPSSRPAVPVLLYHRLASARDAVAPAVFKEQMGRLHQLGFTAITLDDFVRFMRGERVGLPARPVLITFDDGFRSSWKNADSVLARYGWSAAMYIPTGLVGLPGRLTWEELRLLQASGRWQIDAHAGEGHVYVAVDAAGARLPYYAAVRWIDGRQESFAAYKLRVRRDIELGAEMLARRLPGWRPHGTFALPYGDYGQRGSNEPRIEPWLGRFLKSRFAVTFARVRGPLARPGLGLVRRISVSGTWDARTLETQLLEFVRLSRSDATTLSQ